MIASFVNGHEDRLVSDFNGLFHRFHGCISFLQIFADPTAGLKKSQYGLHPYCDIVLSLCPHAMWPTCLDNNCVLYCDMRWGPVRVMHGVCMHPVTAESVNSSVATALIFQLA